MELTKKTTILFPPELHRRLSRLAARRGSSLGELVREACVVQYGVGESETGLDAVKALASMGLPVGSTAKMKRESVPAVDARLP